MLNLGIFPEPQPVANPAPQPQPVAEPEPSPPPIVLLQRNSLCMSCPLYAGAQNVCVWGTGPRDAAVMIVAQNPGYNEDREGVPLIGFSGQLLNDLLEQVGLHRKDVYASNTVKCRTPENRSPEPEEITACRKYLLSEIHTVNPKIILALGGVALTALTGLKGITNKRGLVFPLHKDYQHPARVLATFHTAYASKNEEALPLILADLRALKRALTGEYVNVDAPLRPFTIADVGTVTPDLNATRWSFDLETDLEGRPSPDAWLDKPVMMTLDDGKSVWSFEGELLQYGYYFLEWAARTGKPAVVGHNSSAYDRIVLQQTFGGNVRCDDTMILDFMIDESKHSRKLEALSTGHLGVAPWKAETQGGPPPSEDMDPAAHDAWMRRCATDSRYTGLLYDLFSKEIALDPPRERLYRRIMLPASRCYVNMARRGAPISLENLNQAKTEIKGVVESASAELTMLALQHGEEDFNPNSVDQVRWLLFDRLKLPPVKMTKGGENYSTDQETLLELKGAHPAVDTILRYREYNKLLTGYVESYERKIRDDDFSGPRVYPSWSITSMVTGRPLAIDPYIQAMPRDPRIRRLVRAPEGRVLVQGDFSQIDLRIGCWLAPEENMKQAFRDGSDPHRLLAAEILRIAPEDVTKEQRSNVKPIQFSALFAAEPATIQRQALLEYGVKLTDKEAYDGWVGFHTRWPGYESFYERTVQQLEATATVRSPIGRVRHLPNWRSDKEEVRLGALRQAINFPIQSFGTADMKMIALIILEAEGYETIIDGHDALVLEADEDDADATAARVKQCMEQDVLDVLKERFDIEIDVPIEAEVKVTKEWM